MRAWIKEYSTEISIVLAFLSLLPLGAIVTWLGGWGDEVELAVIALWSIVTEISWHTFAVGALVGWLLRSMVGGSLFGGLRGLQAKRSNIQTQGEAQNFMPVTELLQMALLRVDRQGVPMANDPEELKRNLIDAIDDEVFAIDGRDGPDGGRIGFMGSYFVAEWVRFSVLLHISIRPDLADRRRQNAQQWIKMNDSGSPVQPARGDLYGLQVDMTAAEPWLEETYPEVLTPADLVQFDEPTPQARPFVDFIRQQIQPADNPQ